MNVPQEDALDATHPHRRLSNDRRCETAGMKIAKLQGALKANFGLDCISLDSKLDLDNSLGTRKS